MRGGFFFFLNSQVKRPKGGKWREECKRRRKKEKECTVEKIEHREGDNDDF